MKGNTKVVLRFENQFCCFFFFFHDQDAKLFDVINAAAIPIQKAKIFAELMRNSTRKGISLWNAVATNLIRPARFALNWHSRVLAASYVSIFFRWDRRSSRSIWFNIFVEICHDQLSLIYNTKRIYFLKKRERERGGGVHERHVYYQSYQSQ